MLELLMAAPVAGFFFILTLVTSIHALFIDQGILMRFMLIPWRVVERKEYFRVLSSTLIHGDVFHLLFNMITFYYFAPVLEAGYLGHLKFALVYVLGAIGSHVPVIAKHARDQHYMALGASGAISAVVFSFILYQPMTMLGVMFVIPMPAWLFALLYLAFSYWADQRGRNNALVGGNIGHGAHLWGALSGVVLTVLLDPPVILHFLASF